MLLPDNIHPELSIYYNGAVVLQELKKENYQSLMNLYQKIRTTKEMSFSIFVLSLDWLYLINAARINEKGCVKLCL